MHLKHLTVVRLQAGTDGSAAVVSSSVLCPASGDDCSKHDREADEIVSWENPMYLGTAVL